MKIHSYARNKLLYGIPNKYTKLIPKEMAAIGIKENNLILPETSIGTYT